MPKVAIDSDLCKKDGLCAMVCPEAVLVQNEKGTCPKVEYVDECIACGQCASICPHGAILHSDFPSSSIAPVNSDLFPSADQILELLKDRRSIRAFRGTPVEREKIEQIIDGARYAPSARNTQGTQYTVVQDPALLKSVVDLTIERQKQLTAEDPNALPAFGRLAKAYSEGVDHILHDAPALLVFHADPDTEFAEVNAAQAHQNAALICQGLGLGCFWAGYVTAVCQIDDRIPKLLAIPPNHRVYGMLAVGYPRVKFKKRMERRPATITWL